jgi:hypothetical protein
MKLLRLIFFSIPLIISGCGDASTKAVKQDQPDTIKAAAKKDSSALTRDRAIINNELSSDVLAFEVFKADTTKIKSLFLNPVTLKLKKQKDEEGSAYNLYNFTDGINKLALINNNGFYLRDGEIRNDKVLLNKKIAIGMTKSDLLKLLKVTGIKSDTVIVKDDERSFEAVYIFNGPKLKEIDLGDIVE